MFADEIKLAKTLIKKNEIVCLIVRQINMVCSQRYITNLFRLQFTLKLSFYFKLTNFLAHSNMEFTSAALE